MLGFLISAAVLLYTTPVTQNQVKPEVAIEKLKKLGYKFLSKSSSTYTYQEVTKGDWRALLSLGRGAREPSNTGEMPDFVLHLNSTLLLEEPNRAAIEEWRTKHPRQEFGKHSWEDIKVIVQFNQIVRLDLDFLFLESNEHMVNAVTKFESLVNDFRKKFPAKFLDQADSHPIGKTVPDSTPLPTIVYEELKAMIRLWNWQPKPDPENKISEKKTGLMDIETSSLGSIFGVRATVENIELIFTVPWPDPYDIYEVGAYVPVEKDINAKSIVKRLQKEDLRLGDYESYNRALSKQGFLEKFAASDGFYSYSRTVKLKNATVGSFRDEIVRFAKRVKSLPRK